MTLTDQGRFHFFQQGGRSALIHQQGPACCVACGHSSLRSMADTPSVVTPCRLASGTLLAAREAVQPMTHMRKKLDGGFGSDCGVKRPGGQHLTLSICKCKNDSQCDGQNSGKENLPGRRQQKGEGVSGYPEKRDGLLKDKSPHSLPGNGFKQFHC